MSWISCKLSECAGKEKKDRLEAMNDVREDHVPPPVLLGHKKLLSLTHKWSREASSKGNGQI